MQSFMHVVSPGDCVAYRLPTQELLALGRIGSYVKRNAIYFRYGAIPKVGSRALVRYGTDSENTVVHGSRLCSGCGIDTDTDPVPFVSDFFQSLCFIHSDHTSYKKPIYIHLQFPHWAWWKRSGCQKRRHA